jgi:hypothetical protein
MTKVDKIRRKERRADLKSKGRFLALPFNLIESRAFMSLSRAGVQVFFALYARYNGKNNGQIEASIRLLAKVCRLSFPTTQRAVGELIRKGFIVCTQRSWFHCKDRKGSLYALTTERIEGKQRLDLWKGWPPDIEETKREVPE